jgi:hypothetical protein
VREREKTRRARREAGELPSQAREHNLLDYAWLLSCGETLEMCMARTGLSRDTLERYHRLIRKRAADRRRRALWARAAAQIDRNAEWAREYTRPVRARETA